MAEAAPNPCAAFRSVPPPLHARRADASPRTAKDAPYPTSTGDRGHSGQLKKPPEHVMHKSSGGTYTKPDARVKLIPAEDITYVRHGKSFGRTVGSAKPQKKYCRRSVTPPPSSRKVSLARSTPLTPKPTTPLIPKAAAPLTHNASAPLIHKASAALPHKATTPLSHEATIPLSHKPTTLLNHKPTTPPLHVASCPSPKKVETAENRQIVSLNRPSPICKSVPRGAFSPSSVHVLPAHSSKVPLGTNAEPSPKSVSTLDNTKLCSTSDPVALECQATKDDADPIVEKENTAKLSLLSPRSVLSLSTTEVCPDTRTKPLSRVNLFDEKGKLASPQPEKNIPQAKSPQFTAPAPRVELSTGFEAFPSTKSHIKNERQTNQEAPVSCNMSSGAPVILHNKLCKNPYQPEPTTPGPCVELCNDLRAVPSTKSHISNERQTNQEASISNMSSGAPVILQRKLCKNSYQPEPTTPVPSTKSHISNERQTNQEASISNMSSGSQLGKKKYLPEACWKGKFEVTGELAHTCDGLEAFFSSEISRKVYEASKQMPEILKLEALPLSGLLPKKFKKEPPYAQDIGLCFISSSQRANRSFDHLLENVCSLIGLRTDIGTAELLLFSSKLLIEDDQMKDGKLFLCGVFQKRKDTKGNSCEVGMKLDAAELKRMESNKPKEVGKTFDITADKQTERVKCKKSGIKLELTGEEETNRVNRCLPMLKTLDANTVVSNAAPAVSFFTGSCSPPDSADSPCKSATRAPACKDLVLDSPPGFPLSVPPGFTKAHCSLRRGETGESHIESSSSLALDTQRFALDVPPGFTAAHRGLHTNDTIPSPGSQNGASTLFSEKKPPIKFSLNVTKPVQTSGFAKLLGVKKEAGLAAFSKGTEKIPSIGKANGKDIEHDKVSVEVDDDSEEREFPKFKRLSDILGFSRNNGTTAYKPRRCSEVCRSAAAPVTASKFQETGQQSEKQRHCRKRCQREPSSSDAAVEAATKRLKVNGRIALNGHNQAQGSGSRASPVDVDL